VLGWKRNRSKMNVDNKEKSFLILPQQIQDELAEVEKFDCGSADRKLGGSCCLVDKLRDSQWWNCKSAIKNSKTDIN
jgi:hypothetical protein